MQASVEVTSWDVALTVWKKQHVSILSPNQKLVKAVFKKHKNSFFGYWTDIKILEIDVTSSNLSYL